MRYFVRIGYRGSSYLGWQRQSQGSTVQSEIETIFQQLCQDPKLEIVGCGRTDAGVHAEDYYFHIDGKDHWSEKQWQSLERMLPSDIFLKRVYSPRSQDLHARYDAIRRSYRYDFHCSKNPFLQGVSTRLRNADALDVQAIHQVSEMLLSYGDFEPFCKTGGDQKHYKCDLVESRWEINQDRWYYHIAANRFLRGMVRLIVGMCLQVGHGKMTVEEVRQAMETQSPLPRPLSAPPEGLYLSHIQYPQEELHPLFPVYR